MKVSMMTRVQFVRVLEARSSSCTISRLLMISSFTLDGDDVFFDVTERVSGMLPYSNSALSVSMPLNLAIVLNESRASFRRP